MFLFGLHGPLRRRLACRFCEVAGRGMEYIALTRDTTEADLQELFQPFGRISRVYLAKDKETMISRGFAFISFVHREDATRAMEKLQGYGYDHLILKVSYIFIHTHIYIYMSYIYIYIYMSAGCAC